MVDWIQLAIAGAAIIFGFGGIVEFVRRLKERQQEIASQVKENAKMIREHESLLTKLDERITNMIAGLSELKNSHSDHSKTIFKKLDDLQKELLVSQRMVRNPGSNGVVK